MISTVTWVLALTSGVLAYLVVRIGVFSGVKTSDLFLARSIPVLGFVLCIYACYLIHEFGTAMSANWKRADSIGRELAKKEGLTISINIAEGTPDICKGMYIFTAALAVAFWSALLFVIKCQ